MNNKWVRIYDRLLQDLKMASTYGSLFDCNDLPKK